MLKYKVRVTYLVEQDEVVDVVAENEAAAVEAACQEVEDRCLGEVAQGAVVDIEKVRIGAAPDVDNKDQLKLL